MPASLLLPQADFVPLPWKQVYVNVQIMHVCVSYIHISMYVCAQVFAWVFQDI